MSRKLLLLIPISYLLVLALVSGTTSSQYSFPNIGSIIQTKRVHNLDTEISYTTIQEAIDAPETLDGHTIFVESGIYYEHVEVNKSLSILGENKEETIVDGNETRSVISIMANNVSIHNFTIRNSGSDWPEDINVFLDKCNNTTIQDNIIVNGEYGIYLNRSSHNTIKGNVINEIDHYAVYLATLSAHNLLINNTITYNSGYGVEVGHYAGLNNAIVHNNISFNRYDGIYIVHSNSTIVANNFISSNGHNASASFSGVRLYYSSNNVIRNNTIYFNPEGIFVYCSHGNLPSEHNTIANNLISTNNFGVKLEYSTHNSDSSHSYNEIYGNTFMNNGNGISLSRMEDNSIYHNNFIDNYFQASSYKSKNTWDNGLEGNYWSNYAGVDLDPDGIGDSCHEIDQNNTDNYPLMGMFSDFNVTSEHHVQTVCNSLVSDFQFNGTAIIFNVTGENGTAGFCRICIPTVLMDETFQVYINGTEILPAPLPLPCSNGTHSYVCFNYTHSTQGVIIVPEFPSLVVLSLFTIATLLAFTVYRKKHFM